MTDWFEWHHVPRCLSNNWQGKGICSCRYNAIPDCPTCGPDGTEDRLRAGITRLSAMEAVAAAAEEAVELLLPGGDPTYDYRVCLDCCPDVGARHQDGCVVVRLLEALAALKSVTPTPLTGQR